MIIPKKLQRRPFSTQEAVDAGISKPTLTRLVAADLLERVSRGVYQLSDVDDGTMEYLYQAATLRCGAPSCICLLSALEHYHLTDEITKQTWMMVPHSKRVQSSQLKLIRSRNPHWNIGIKKRRGYWITTIDRTLIDGIIYKRVLGSEIPLSALKQALTEKKTKLSTFHAMAKQMGVAKRVRAYIEALAL
jgi:predicted transcriptional regulator of viral defense system